MSINPIIITFKYRLYNVTHGCCVVRITAISFHDYGRQAIISITFAVITIEISLVNYALAEGSKVVATLSKNTFYIVYAHRSTDDSIFQTHNLSLFNCSTSFSNSLTLAFNLATSSSTCSIAPKATAISFGDQ